MTRKEALAAGRERLHTAGIEEADLDAWYLLSDAAGITRAQYFTEPDAALEESCAARYLDGIEKRERRVPLQHILGTQEFMGFSFLVNGSVLIPRQDTEILAVEAQKAIRAAKRTGAHDYKVRVLDVCTGSGCIIISLAKLEPIDAYACDISAEALSVASENAMRLGADVMFLRGDLLEPADGTYDIIVSNPPYIASAQIGDLMPEVRDHEPRLALDGSEDGLWFYRRIAAGAGNYLNTPGKLLLEIGCEQAEQVSGLLTEAGFRNIRVVKDYAGLDRVVQADWG